MRSWITKVISRFREEPESFYEHECVLCKRDADASYCIPKPTEAVTGWLCENCGKTSTGMLACIHCGSNAC